MKVLKYQFISGVINEIQVFDIQMSLKRVKNYENCEFFIFLKCKDMWFLISQRIWKFILFLENSCAVHMGKKNFIEFSRYVILNRIKIDKLKNSRATIT